MQFDLTSSQKTGNQLYQCDIGTEDTYLIKNGGSDKRSYSNESNKVSDRLAASFNSMMSNERSNSVTSDNSSYEIVAYKDGKILLLYLKEYQNFYQRFNTRFKPLLPFL